MARFIKKPKLYKYDKSVFTIYIIAYQHVYAAIGTKARGAF